MRPARWASTVAATGFTSSTAAQLCRIHRSSKYLRSASAELPSGEKPPSVHIIIPVFRERSVVSESVARFEMLLDANPQATVTYVTTSREDGDSFTTADALDAIIRHHRMRRVHDASPAGTMAHQVNYAVSQALADEPHSSIVGIYNVDSRPPAST